MSAASKLKELRQEFSAEKHRYLLLEKASEEKMGRYSGEITALHSRMQSSHESHMMEVARLKAQIDQQQHDGGARNDQNVLIQRVTEVK